MENRNWRQDVETEGIRKIDREEWKRHPQDTQGGCLVDDMYDVKIGCYVDAVNRSLETVRIPSERVPRYVLFTTMVELQDLDNRHTDTSIIMLSLTNNADK